MLSYYSTLCASLTVLYITLVSAAGDPNPDVQTSFQDIHRARKLTGRFLQITDIHPDPFFKFHSDPDHACHRKKGSAGYYGAQTSDCDSPLNLVNATFDWIKQTIKDDVDFVIWTGDSARHDNDERIPRSKDQVISQNELLVQHVRDTFNDRIPIIPTLGNNDILPHNLFSAGPNKWTKHYTRIWKSFIPEPQRHQFARGGWFYVEAIPNQLAVFSLNTLYFFSSNAVVDGCASSSEPGYEQFEWLRVQLQIIRERGMKALLIGHVPPARNDARSTWDETCWQKYALWLRQYRDVIIGSVYGHMNIDHFIVQDFNEIKYDVLTGETRSQGSHEVETQGTQDYLMELRKDWSKLPVSPPGFTSEGKKHHKKYVNDIGGPYAERFAVSFVSPSIVPNYFPTIRLYEYNITGLDTVPSSSSSGVQADLTSPRDEDDIDELKKKKKKKKKGKKGKKKAKFVVPLPPSKTAAPGPAYSPQTLSLRSIVQLYANLTHINNDDNFKSLEKSLYDLSASDTNSLSKNNPRKFEYELEYETAHEKDIYKMSENMSVLKWVQLAGRIGKYEPDKNSLAYGVDEDFTIVRTGDAELDAEKDKKKKKKKKKKRKIINKTWFAFVDRATVATMDEDELHRQFGDEIE